MVGPGPARDAVMGDRTVHCVIPRRDMTQNRGLLKEDTGVGALTTCK